MLKQFTIALGLVLTTTAAEAALRNRAIEKMNMAWQQLGDNRYYFSAAGAAFLDTRVHDRKPTSGIINFSSSESQKLSPSVTVGYGWHIHRYVALEMAYQYVSGADFKGTATATNGVMGGKTLNGSFNYSESISSHSVGLSLVANTYDIGDIIGLSFRVGGMFYDISDEFTFTGSGTIDGAAITTGNNVAKITDSGFTWNIGTSIFYAPSVNSRIEARFDYVDEMEIDAFSNVSMASGHLGYRYRF